jgi:nicotinamide phosphoribosyltransferase
MTRNKFAPVRALFLTDAYKLGHRILEPAKTEYVYSNFTNRNSRIGDIKKVVAFGLQAFIERYIVDEFVPFFEASEDEVAALYEERVTQILGPNPIGSDHIRALHRKGFLPLEFRSVKEGTLVPLQVPTLTVENTDPEFAWLTNYIETILSTSIWFPSTSATKDLYVRKFIEGWAERTGSDKDFIDWQWHDFSFRGQTSEESAAMSGAAHLLSFKGTDNLNAFDWIDSYYPGDNGFVGGSVSATEHSIMTSRGREGEFDTYVDILNKVPTGIISIVSDTYNLWNVIDDFLPRLHEQIVGRDGKLVIRPDSGDPADIICGTVAEFGKGETSEERGLVEALWLQFGGKVNAKGLRTLDSHIGAIYGDSITLERANDMFTRLEAKGFAIDNIVFGAGSLFFMSSGIGKMEPVTRDTFGSAMKATWEQVDGVGMVMQKDPATGSGKKSAAGRLAVFKNEEDELELIQNATPEQEAASELTLVWKDGKFIRYQSFGEVRDNLATQKF